MNQPDECPSCGVHAFEKHAEKCWVWFAWKAEFQRLNDVSWDESKHWGSRGEVAEFKYPPRNFGLPDSDEILTGSGKDGGKTMTGWRKLMLQDEPNMETPELVEVCVTCGLPRGFYHDLYCQGFVLLPALRSPITDALNARVKPVEPCDGVIAHGKCLCPLCVKARDRFKDEILGGKCGPSKSGDLLGFALRQRCKWPGEEVHLL